MLLSIDGIICGKQKTFVLVLFMLLSHFNNKTTFSLLLKSLPIHTQYLIPTTASWIPQTGSSKSHLVLRDEVEASHLLLQV